jgi:hypothetical protein
MDEATHRILHYRKNVIFLSFSIESHPKTCTSHPLFFFLETWSFANEVLTLLLFNPGPFPFFSFFLGSFFCWREIPLIRIFLENHLVNSIKVGTRNDQGLIWILWNVWRIMPSSIRIGHYQA